MKIYSTKSYSFYFKSIIIMFIKLHIQLCMFTVRTSTTTAYRREQKLTAISRCRNATRNIGVLSIQTALCSNSQAAGEMDKKNFLETGSCLINYFLKLVLYSVLCDLKKREMNSSETKETAKIQMNVYSSWKVFLVFITL